VDKASSEALVDVLTSSNSEATPVEKQTVLSEMDWMKRLRKGLELLTRQLEVLRMSDKIQNQVRFVS
jgi:ATP-dependent Lon protease